MSQQGSLSPNRPRPRVQVSSNGLPNNPLPNSLVAGRRIPPQEEARSPEDDLLTPVGRTAILAFQNAARAAANGDNDRARERERELAEEKERQRRIRDKVQGTRLNGKSRAGDVDGMSESFPVQ